MYKLDNLWTQILYSWSKINFHQVDNSSTALDEIIWYNTLIRVSNKVILWTHWIEKGIMLFSDLFRENRSLKTYKELGVNWLEFQTLVSEKLSFRGSPMSIQYIIQYE